MEEPSGIFSGKTLLLVNVGAISKKFVIQKLKKTGVRLIVLDREKPWAQRYIDTLIVSDNTNHESALDALERFLASNRDIKIDGVITFWEDDVLLTSKIAEKYGWVGIPHSIAVKARNKFLFRDFCRANGIAAPSYRLIHDRSELAGILEDFEFPLVIKPTLGAVSSYVVKIETPEDLYATYDYIVSNISVEGESALSDGIEILIEEYIDGDEVDVDMLIQNGKVKYWSVMDNYKTDEPFFIEKGDAMPSRLPDKTQHSLRMLAEETLEKLGVMNGCIHFEAKAGKDGPVPIEVNLRMGGEYIYLFHKEAWRVDMIESAVKIALGIYIEPVERPEVPYKYMRGQIFTLESSGIVSRLDVDEEVENVDGYEDIRFYKEVGDTILVPPEGFEYLGWVAVSGENQIEADENIEKALEYIDYDVYEFDHDSSIGKTERRNRFSHASLRKDILKGYARIENIRRSESGDRPLAVGIAYNGVTKGQSDASAPLMHSGVDALADTLKGLGHTVHRFDFNRVDRAYAGIAGSKVDIVFNLVEHIHGSPLLRPNAAAILDILQTPYIGSNTFTLSVCRDKIRMKKLLSYHEIPTPNWDYLYAVDEEIDDELEYPLIVKPSIIGDSAGITNASVVRDEAELRAQVKYVIETLKSPVLLEEYVDSDEYDVFILGTNPADLVVLPICRTIFDALPDRLWHVHGYEAVWWGDRAYRAIERQYPLKNVSKKLESLITEISIDTYRRLGCYDYGQVKVKVDSHGNPYVIDLVPTPPIGPDDLVSSLAEVADMPYDRLVQSILQLAIERYRTKPPYHHLQSGLL